ncbi:MAG: hypothetical protein JWR15_1509 [Prosthecobacter sp.]|nr:hypothetical protein [Prosthecobacter sp.]
MAKHPLGRFAPSKVGVAKLPRLNSHFHAAERRNFAPLYGSHYTLLPTKQSQKRPKTAKLGLSPPTPEKPHFPFVEGQK